MPDFTDLSPRFWAKVAFGDWLDCWLWTAHRWRGGYGAFKIGRENQGAHRVAYELLVGPIPDGLTIDHLCRVPHCVNPLHMEPVTMRENTLRGTSPAARHAKATHCVKGHPFDLRRGDQRACSICRRDADRRYRIRKAQGT